MSSSRNKVRVLALKHLGNKCANPDCRWQNADGSFGCDDPDMLQIDHPSGSGNIDRKTRNLHTIYRDVLNVPLGTYQLLCANCNWKKRKLNAEVVGRPHTEANKQRISNALRGRIRTAAHRANISAGGKGKHSVPCPEETKRKLSAIHKGRIITPEWRAKISATKRLRNAAARGQAELPL